MIDREMSGNLFFGRRVRLSALRPEDAHAVARWYEDAEFGRMFDSSPAVPRTPARIARWFEDADRSRDSFTFAIRPLYTEELLGIVDLDTIQWTHRTAWLAIAIGEPDNRGQGYGTDAMHLLLRFAFDELNLHRLQLTVFEYNRRAIRLYERLGFVREGVFREALLRDGRRWDMYLYGLLAREYAAAGRNP